jgi:hypothetical protein
MRRSKRIAAQPASSQKPAERVRGNKIKTLGLAESMEDPKVTKKKQLLLCFKGEQRAATEEAISDLLGLQFPVV